MCFWLVNLLKSSKTQFGMECPNQSFLHWNPLPPQLLLRISEAAGLCKNSKLQKVRGNPPHDFGVIDDGWYVGIPRKRDMLADIAPWFLHKFIYCPRRIPFCCSMVNPVSGTMCALNRRVCVRFKKIHDTL